MSDLQYAPDVWVPEYEKDVFYTEKEKKEMEHQVNSPDYYNVGNIETIDLIKASLSQNEFRGYLKGNIFKYLNRHMHKGMPVKDLMKAEWYLKRLIKEMKEL